MRNYEKKANNNWPFLQFRYTFLLLHILYYTSILYDRLFACIRVVHCDVGPVLVKHVAKQCFIDEGVGHVTEYNHHEGQAAAMKDGCDGRQDNEELVTTLRKPELEDVEAIKRFSAERCYMLF